MIDCKKYTLTFLILCKNSDFCHVKCLQLSVLDRSFFVKIICTYLSWLTVVDCFVGACKSYRNGRRKVSVLRDLQMIVPKSSMWVFRSQLLVIKICTETVVLLVRLPHARTGIFKSKMFIQDRYNYTLQTRGHEHKCFLAHSFLWILVSYCSNIILLDMASLVPVAVGKPHCWGAS